MRILVVANGDRIPSQRLLLEARKSDYIIAADGGAEALFAISITPHLLVGDFDSVSHERLSAYQKQGIEIRQFVPEKDFSDLEIALNCCVERSATEIILAGALGGRADYALTNVFSCVNTDLVKVPVTILEQQSHVLLPLCGPIETVIALKPQSDFSLVPISPEVINVSLRGAARPLQNALLTFGRSLTISNRALGSEVTLSVTAGRLLLRYMEP